MRIQILVMLFAILLTAGCGYGSKYNSGPMMGGAAAQITQLAPNTATAGGGAFTLTINGTGFTMSSAVYWNGVAHSAMYVTGNQITTVISASDIANPGMVPVYVRVNNVNSNTMNFTVN
jgi:predicted heme/steroid binding protein